LIVDWNDNAEQASFRKEVREVLRTKLPENYRDLVLLTSNNNRWDEDRVSDDPARRADAEAWTKALSERGWFAPQWPREYGGGGLSPMEMFIFKEEMAKAGAPPVGGQGTRQLGPTLILHGTEEQKQQHLGAILRGEVNFRQGYSEPGAGSDLASLQTSAVRDGDEYVVNGQKIWTSGAHLAQWLYVLVRTDPAAPKHRGISFLLVDINSPGLSVRPLINACYDHEFNETFFEDVRVPVANRIGEENRGWYVAATLLDFERSNVDGAVVARKTINELIECLRTKEGWRNSTLDRQSTLRQEIAQNYIETEVLYNFSFRIISLQNVGQVPNYEASITKLFNSELQQRLARTGTRVFGLYSNLWDTEDPLAPMGARFTRRYVRTTAMTVSAGTSEIQRNVIATRGLGLPRG